jgi:glycosyltransferase involved in cell wall biosynthesis
MRHDRPIKVLLVIEQCNPDWPSVPLVGYQFFKALNHLADVTLVTHGRNQSALEQQSIQLNKIVYIHESWLAQTYYRVATAGLPGGMSNWPLYHVLTYPIYAEFNAQVYEQFQAAVRHGEYDIVHVMTPMMPRYPVKLVQACGKTPFLLGPVNGGIPFPKGFQSIANQEFAYFNFFRALGRWLIPGYTQTYRNADRVLAGSTYTRDWLRQAFGIEGDRIDLFYENGLEASFFASEPRTPQADPLRLLFVGRLVPYKAADMVIEAISQLPLADRARVHLTVVGDGPQRQVLEKLVTERSLNAQVTFAGWVNQAQTRNYYQDADVFCFPSIREFGGAVVLEAMACGLPCIVADYGGIGEYVTAETGFKIEPRSRDFLIQGVAQAIQTLLHQPKLYTKLSQGALKRAEQFRWPIKAEGLIKIYHQLLLKKQTPQ